VLALYDITLTSYRSDGSKLIGVPGNKDMVTVLAFSVPESVEEGLKDKFSIDQVLQERFSSRISDIPCLKSVSISKQQITLPHVLL
jgi:transcriptional antiterminator